MDVRTSPLVVKKKVKGLPGHVYFSKFKGFVSLVWWKHPVVMASEGSQADHEVSRSLRLYFGCFPM